MSAVSNLPGYGSREVNLTETREEIDRLRREDATLFEDGGASGLSGEEYRRVLARDLSNPPTRQTILGLPWGSGTGQIREGARAGYVFCVRIGDHLRPWFRYVPLGDDLAPEVDADGRHIVVDDTLACLAAADPRDPATVANLPDAMYEAAFDAWRIAKDHIVESWMFNADPANLQPVVPRVMRDAAQLVQRHGGFLAEGQDELVERLQAPYSPRILRAIREVTQLDIPERERVNRLAQEADRLGLSRQAAPEPLPPITGDDVYLLCWTAIVPATGLPVPV